MHNLSKSFALFAFLAFSSSCCFACPSVGRLPDVNCDGTARVVVVGDSVVYGVGDVRNGGKGGYVLRIAQKFPTATFDNRGTPGEEVRRVLGIIQDSFNGVGDTTFASSLTNADIIILDIGRNDWWKFRPAIVTWRNLKRLRELIQTEVNSVSGHKPLVVTAQLMGANRTGQGAWILELNKYIAANSKSLTPGDLRFNSVSKKLLIDRVHPSSLGYDAIAKILYTYLTETLLKHISIFRQDSDHDGLYDEYETERFGTSPSNPDTDGDGIRDGKDGTPA
jgi:lysophospholipase L1-like esterase